MKKKYFADLKFSTNHANSGFKFMTRIPPKSSHDFIAFKRANNMYDGNLISYYTFYTGQRLGYINLSPSIYTSTYSMEKEGYRLFRFDALLVF